ncbi:hypothetical protein NDU88_007866 [Pleurodeles waltl]|uniref:Uncharacterized protein n=1 Tax=Pleurodeles waltl TaxID=8319 RepID=A0AAV7PSN8_PLEWA|nr:hypothetical protein NDU88_007866 [Pleurodeles waltl]
MGWCNRAIIATDTSHTPELAEKCPGGTIWGTAHPEVIPDQDIQVKDAESLEEGKPERRVALESEEEKGAEPEEEKRAGRRRKAARNWRREEGIQQNGVASKETQRCPRRPTRDATGAATSLEGHG